MTLADDLTAILAAHDTALADARADVTRLRGSLTEATADAARWKDQATQAAGQIADLTAERDRLLARIAELEPQPEPARRTLFGACPTNPGGESLAAAQRVIDKWGTGAAVRQFRSALATPHAPEGASIVHTSYKPDLDDVIAGRLDAQIRAVAKATPAGHIIEIWHEADSKVRSGSIDKAKVIAAKNRFYDLVKAENPDALVCTTYTGWLFEPKSKLDPEEWADVKADLLGVDLDGIQSWPYVDYTDEIPRAADAARRWGYAGWCVPELGMDIQPADTDGAARVEWIIKHARLLADAGAVYVAWFDYAMSAARTPGYQLHTPAEVAAWKALII